MRTLVRGWDRCEVGEVLAWHRGQTCVIVGGIGRRAASRAALRGLAAFPATQLVISAGFAGATSAQYIPTRAYWASSVVDGASGETFAAEGGEAGCVVVTLDKIAGVATKRIAAPLGGLIDMEAAGVAKVALTQGIAFRCLKGVTDGPDDRMPSLQGFITTGGQFRTAAFAAHAALRPWTWPDLIRLGQRSAQAARGLKAGLRVVLDEGRNPR